jgi:hypothetical protein
LKNDGGGTIAIGTDYKLSLEAKNIYAIGSTEKLLETEASFFEKYINEVKKRNIIFNDFLKKDSNKKSEDVIKTLHKKIWKVSVPPAEVEHM